MNNITEDETINKVCKKMLSWPKWYFNFQLLLHRNGDFAKILKESCAFYCIMERMNKKDIE